MEQLPLFTEPEQPDLRPILLLHRGHDGHIAFCRKDDQGNHQDLFSVPAKDLDGVFPQLSPLLERDSYFSIHGMYRGGFGAARWSPDGLNLPRAYRESEGVRWLTCCFADIDCHNLGIEVGTAIGAIINAQDRGEIPAASMLTRSGRGVWAFWFLEGEDGNGLQRAWREQVRLWCAVQHEIGRRFSDLGYDWNCKDTARVTRIAGSVNSKASARVEYWLQLRGDGQRYTYRLKEMADLLGVEVRRQPVLEQAAKNVLAQARGKKGQMARWAYDLERFQRLEEKRRCWRVGLRRAAVFILAGILKSLKRDPGPLELADIKDAVYATWLLCEQPPGEPFTWSEAWKTAVGVESRPVRHQTIADQLDVTLEESAVIGWPAASRFGGAGPRVSLTRAEEKERRRQLLREWIASQPKGFRPTAAQAVEYLDRNGLTCVPNTALSDLNAIGCGIPKSRQRRSRKSARKNGRKLFGE